MIGAIVRRLRALEFVTRPEPPELRDALRRRWEELPAHVRTPAQAIGRRTAGCEGTHGVFPRCNLACTPCYHSREANRVRVDGDHTVAQVDRQMALLSRLRGPGQNAQLIGGEVTLLDPDDHAAALQSMIAHGRKPMSMSHGDFDYEHLLRIALGADGRPRFRHISFAGHFDRLMYGRRGIRRPAGEGELNPYRRRFCEMFTRLEREHGVGHYLAHNMTVTPANLGEVAGVIRDCHGYGFRMFSFQPAAFVGNSSRWKEDYRAFDDDAVWAEIERGAGCRLPRDVFQIGDRRCNRTVYGAYVGERYVPLLDDRDARDLAVRDDFYRVLGGVDFGVPAPLMAARLLRALAPHPIAVARGAAWLLRFGSRCGGPRALMRDRPRVVTFVMHSFMDASVVRPAWELIGRGETSRDPAVEEARERLLACSYAMAHPDSGELVPACVQHSVLDPVENGMLARQFPLAPREALVPH